MKIHLGGGVKGGGGFTDDRGVYQAALEHGFTVYCYAITVKPVWGVGEGSWGASWDVVVVTGSNWTRRGTGGGSGSGGRGGGWRGEIEILLDWDNGRYKYNVAQLTNKGQSLVSIWPLCRVWKTTALLCACHRDTEEGREEKKMFDFINFGFQLRYMYR